MNTTQERIVRDVFAGMHKGTGHRTQTHVDVDTMTGKFTLKLNQSNSYARDRVRANVSHCKAQASGLGTFIDRAEFTNASNTFDDASMWISRPQNDDADNQCSTTE